VFLRNITRSDKHQQRTAQEKLALFNQIALKKKKKKKKQKNKHRLEKGPKALAIWGSPKRTKNFSKKFIHVNNSQGPKHLISQTFSE
jgi:hypothetical protein